MKLFFSTPLPLWFIRWTHSEYWSSQTVYWLLSPVLIWNAWRAKSVTYFSAVNPRWKYGGLFGESKNAILDQIPSEYVPKTRLVQPQQAFPKLWDDDSNATYFPVIVKPDFGERGRGVIKIDSISALVDHYLTAKEPFIIQEYVDYPIELAVFYSRKPSESVGKISSITLKEFLCATGDGEHTLEELVQTNTRARFQAKKLEQKFRSLWKNILPKGKKIELEGIGNHCRGTRFINANYLITKELELVFEKISRQIDGFQYGRFDLRVSSLEALYEGKNIKIMELNGTNAEPTHVYDSTHGFFKMYRDLAWHWTRLAEISIENQKLGIKTSALFPFLKELKQYQQ
jgi:rRNA maturation protein Rpf1